LTSTFTLREQNPCNLEPITFQVTLKLTSIVAGPPGTPHLLRSATIERFTGVGDFGTIYFGHQQTNVILHRDNQGFSGTSGRVDLVKGSAPGTSYLIVTRINTDRNGTLRDVVNQRKCIGTGGTTF